MAAVLAAVGVAGLPHLRRRPADAVTARYPDGARPAVPQFATRSPGAEESGAGQSGADESAARESVAGGSAGAGGSPASAGLGTTAELDRVLAGLSDLREQAYAQRRPDLLTAVYASAALRAADGRQLDRSVPSGCSLIGVRTVYRDPQFTAGRSDGAPAEQPLAMPAAGAAGRSGIAAGRPADVAPRPTEAPTGERTVSITVTASLPSATLRCGAGVRGRTRAMESTRLRLLLSNSGDGWRISSEHPA